MKTSFCTLMSVVSLAVGVGGQARAAEGPAATYIVSERGPNHRTIQRVLTETNGLMVADQLYQELATGLHFQRNGEWIESSEQINPIPGGGAATNGCYQVYFPLDIAQGVIEVITPDGRHLQSRPLGVSYFDGTNSVLIGALSNSIGQILPSGNQVLYTNAFVGIRADLLCTYRKSGFECDLVFREQPLEPELYELNGPTTRLQLLTEFFNTTVPIQEPDVPLNGLANATLGFGAMSMVRGYAFLIDGQGPAVPVAKSWQRLEGRDFLIEELELADIQSQLATLPPHMGRVRNNDSRSFALRRIPGSAGILPALVGQAFSVPPLRDLGDFPVAHRSTGLESPVNRQTGMSALHSRQDAGAPRGAMKMAKASPPGKGFVLDYTLVGASETNFTFKGDTTYYVSDTVNLSGTTTIEGGAVIKFTNQPSAKLSVKTVICQTAPYRPAILTSKDDNSVGDTISGSTGNPTNYNGGTYLYEDTPSQANTYKYLRLCYAGTGISIYRGGDVWHSQFVKCNTAMWRYDDTWDMNLRNVLFSQCGMAIDGSGTANCEHLTVDGGAFRPTGGDGGPAVNSLFTAVTNFHNVTLNNCVTNSSSAGFYQTTGAGNYYLADGSTNRNAGTTSINATLLADLKGKSTYPPIVLSNTTVSTDTILSPQAQRDTDAPDLGYHYDSLDYLTCMYTFTNAAALTVSAGTAIACYNDTGILLVDGSSITAIGTPLAPIWFTRYSAVQEQPVSLPATNSAPVSGVPLNPYRYEYNGSNGVFRFCNFSCPAGGGYHLYHNGRWLYTDLLVQDCQLWNGLNEFSGNTNTVATVHNNLFRRSRFTAGTASSTVQNSLSVSNNLFWGIPSNLRLVQPSNVVWYAFNNAFDTCLLNVNSKCTNGYNAYITSTNRITPTNVFDQVLTNALGWQSGPLGDYYQPTNSSLINAGSTNADLVGLYHFTTQTNQVKETNSTVDIGFHYVATTNGVPIDTDLDGLPDYYEDANGNGTVDSDETDWQSALDSGLRVRITEPKPSANLP